MMSAREFDNHGDDQDDEHDAYDNYDDVNEPKLPDQGTKGHNRRFRPPPVFNSNDYQRLRWGHIW